MLKVNKTLLLITAGLGILVVSVLTQTIYRNRQVEALRTEIREAIKKSTGPDAAVAATQVYEDRIKFAFEHKPLLNLGIGLSSSFAQQKSELCPKLYTVMTSNTVVLDFLENTNLSVEERTRTTEQVQEIQQAARSLYLISGCLP
ncbi:MAG: hypothetical protein AAB585_00350 [Patescibacteria group bacterium]